MSKASKWREEIRQYASGSRLSPPRWARDTVSAEVHYDGCMLSAEAFRAIPATVALDLGRWLVDMFEEHGVQAAPDHTAPAPQDFHPRCVDCRHYQNKFFYSDSAPCGRCHRYPPHQHLTTWAFPQVTGEWWCGEWVPRR